jgi:hypothetical protein
VLVVAPVHEQDPHPGQPCEPIGRRGRVQLTGPAQPPAGPEDFSQDLLGVSPPAERGPVLVRPQHGDLGHLVAEPLCQRQDLDVESEAVNVGDVEQAARYGVLEELEPALGVGDVGHEPPGQSAEGSAPDAAHERLLDFVACARRPP